MSKDCGTDNLPNETTSPDDLHMVESPSTSAEETDFLTTAVNDNVTVALIKAGPAGISAAAAIRSVGNKKRLYGFETNPSIRKRHMTRLIRKLRHTIEEFATRVGQQAILLLASPTESHNYKVFGTRPLLDVMRNLQPSVTQELKTKLMKGSPPQVEDDPSLYPLPPLVIDGIPTPLEKMTQAQLRAFIPYMLKYSTLRGKPGWGRESMKPPWWPTDLPWANVRMDVRSENDKQNLSWTFALRQIVLSCYKYHGREELLVVYNEEGQKAESDDNSNEATALEAEALASKIKSEFAAGTVTNQVSTSNLQTASDAEDPISTIQIDPNNATVTLPDGTFGRVEVMTMGDGVLQGSINNISDLEGNSQIILTGDDGQIREILAVIGTDSILQSKDGSYAQLTIGSDGTVYLMPVRIAYNDGEDARNGDHVVQVDEVECASSASGTLTAISNPHTEGLFQVISANGERVMDPHNIVKREEM